MGNFLGSFVISLLILVVFVVAVRYSAQENNYSGWDVPFKERKIAFYIDKDNPKPESGPYLIQALIVSEISDQMTLDISYHLPKGDRTPYFISVYPIGSHFNEVRLHLDPSRNVVRTTIVFKPEISLIGKLSTSYIHTNIEAVRNKNMLQRVYRRRLILSKTWRNTKRLQQKFLRSSAFHAR